MTGRSEAFAAWRRCRPFWGSALAIIAGVEIYAIAKAPMGVAVMQGLPGLLTVCVAVVPILMGAITMARPEQRVVTGWVILVLGPISILATNLGGFVVGMVLLIVGGSLILSWEEPVAEADRLEDDAFAEELSARRSFESPPGHRPVDSDDTAIVPGFVPGFGSGSGEPVGAFGPGGVTTTTTTTEPSGAGLRNPWRSRVPTSLNEAGALDPPPTQVRSTLMLPLVLVVIAASGFLATPAQAAPAECGLQDLLSCIFPPSPTTGPTTSPGSGSGSDSGTGSGAGGGATGSGTGGGTAADLPASACPTGDLPAGTTRSGTAATDGAAAVQACKQAGETASVGAKAAAAAADGAPQISDVISPLKASRLEMSGFTYNGIVTLQSPSGPVKTLSFTLDKLSVQGMNQTYGFGSGGRNTVSITNQASTVTISGDVQLYVTKMTGKIFGLLELTFSPDFPPPLVLDSMYFTDTTSQVALVRAGKITLPDLKMPVG